MAMKTDINNLIIKSVDRGYGIYRADGSTNWYLSQISNLDIKTEGEKVTKNDAQEIPVATFWKSKNVTVTGNTSFFSLDFTAAQWGTKKRLATSTDKIETPYSEDFKTVDSQTTYTLKHTPCGVKGAEIKSIMSISRDDAITKIYKLGTGTATETTFLLDADKKQITLPTGIEAGTRFFIPYTYLSSSSVVVINSAKEFPRAEKIVFEVTGYTMCDADTSIGFYVVMENGTLSVNSEIPFGTTDEIPFEINAAQDPCSDDKSLIKIIVPGDAE